VTPQEAAVWGALIGAAPGLFGIGLTVFLRHRDKKGERAEAAVADLTAWSVREGHATSWQYAVMVQNRGPAQAHNLSLKISPADDNGGHVRMLYDITKPIPLLDVGPPFPIGYIPLGGVSTLRIELSWEDGRKGRQQKTLTRPTH
jgi:hypothetical protein